MLARTTSSTPISITLCTISTAITAANEGTFTWGNPYILYRWRNWIKWRRRFVTTVGYDQG